MLTVIFICLFFLSTVLLLHTFVLYPVSVLLISIIGKKKYSEDISTLPHVSVLISVYNEEVVISATLRNLLTSEYPPEKLQIIVGSDCSTDETDSIVSKIADADRRVRFQRFDHRRGKANVINDLVSEAEGEILVFADANTLYHPRAILHMAKYYADERVGGVSGRLVLEHLDSARSSGSHEDSYWNIETRLKAAEGSIGQLIGANGGIYSIRKALFTPLPASRPLTDDFFLSMMILAQGREMLYTNESIGAESAAPTSEIEFARRIRNNSLNLHTIQPLKKLLSPSFGFVAYGFWSHKLLRWISPLLFAVMVATSFALMQDSLFIQVIVLLEALFFGLALIGWVSRKVNQSIALFSLPYYFILTLAAMSIGIYRFIIGTQTSYWQSTKR